MISCVILAAGQSKRLGRPKQLLDLDGEPVLRHTVRNASISDLDQIVLVLGYEAWAIEDAVGDWGQNLVVNPDYAAGQSTSLKLGLSAVDPTAEAVMFLLGDQPQVGPDLINRILSAFRKGQGRIVMPSYQRTPSNPVLFAREFFPKLATIQGDEGARSVVMAHRPEIGYVEVETDIPLDIDTVEDYEKLLRAWPTKSTST